MSSETVALGGGVLRVRVTDVQFAKAFRFFLAVEVAGASVVVRSVETDGGQRSN
jgi:hypothetical protein